jgi:uncharacterized membrane protein
MAKKKVGAFSGILALVFSLIAIAAAIVPNYLSINNDIYNKVLGDFTALGLFFTKDGIQAQELIAKLIGTKEFL